MNNIGAQLDALEKKSDAIPWFEKAAKCDPGEELYRNNVKSTQKELAAQTRENQCDALFDKGRGQDKAGDHQGAIGTYKQLLSLCPKNCSAMNNIGVRFDELGNKSDAIPWFEKAAQCDPGNKTYEKNLTATKRELAELQQQASNKSQCDSLFQSGLAKSKAGDKQGAVTIYRKVLSLCPDHCMAMNNIGSVLDSMGSRSQAIPWFEKASACDPGNSLFKKNIMLTKQEIAAQPTPATPKQSSALSEVKPGPPPPVNRPPRSPESSGNSSSAAGNNDRECERLANEASCRGKRGDIAGNQALIRKTMELCPNGWKPSPAFNPYCK
jgi:tetratricopeptide (TPR) repeat protein